MIDSELAATESFLECYFLLHYQVNVSPLEDWMILFLKDD